MKKNNIHTFEKTKILLKQRVEDVHHPIDATGAKILRELKADLILLCFSIKTQTETNPVYCIIFLRPLLC